MPEPKPTSEFDSTTMHYSVPTPILNLPIQANRRPKPYIRTKKLKRWINDLPTADCQRTATQFIKQLGELNNAHYPPQDRACLMDNLRPLAQQLINTLSQHVRKSHIPLNSRALERNQLLQNILSGMAMGYKLVVNQLAISRPHREHDDMLLREALYFSSQYLARQLLEAYLVYMPEPKNCWLELHQLFQYATETAMATLPVDDPFPDISIPIANTISLIYKRIVLLSLAEPYHLMKNEAREFYYLLSAWSNNCELLPSSNMPCVGEFSLDANADNPPRFVSSEIEWVAKKGYLLDISEVQKRLDTQLQRVLRANFLELEDDANHSLMQQRCQRDMLLRLADAWQGNLTRNGTRHSSDENIEMATGLNAGHHYISLGREFSPEQDELRIISDKIEPTTYASAYHSALQKDRLHHNHVYKTNPWWQRNFSRNGAALNCSVNCPRLHTAVGELVAYCEPEKLPLRWKVGAIRWLHSSLDNHLDLGIMNIADSAVPVASKAMAGCGEGTDYFRSLLIPKQISLQQRRCLIVPAHVYDINSVLMINLRNKIFYLKLVRLLLCTQSFHQFEFEIVRKPVVSGEDLFTL
ncbi:hypothetical protein MNBD_GAMMA25-486 [hydrothermal vent metagenome]|uniref:Molecular chaperone n=1 Tax=hydrothermal vent metagenome TaxID=652676 RepID=A0A3B1BCV6_9ZZZZ